MPLKQEPQRHQRTLEKLQLRNSSAWEFAVSSGNLPGMARSSTVPLEMPQCYCFRGRRDFDPRSVGPSYWELTADHYPRLKMHGGHLTPYNVRLAHRVCNRHDKVAAKINAMLGKRMSLEHIAEKLNVEKVPTIHGTNRWTAASVRKVFVS